MPESLKSYGYLIPVNWYPSVFIKDYEIPAQIEMLGGSELDIDDDNDNYDDPFRSGRGLLDVCLLMWHMLGGDTNRTRINL